MTFPSTPRPARARAVRRWAGAAAVVVASSLALAGCSDDPTPVSDDTGTATEEPQPSETGSDAGQESDSGVPDRVTRRVGVPVGAGGVRHRGPGLLRRRRPRRTHRPVPRVPARRGRPADRGRPARRRRRPARRPGLPHPLARRGDQLGPGDRRGPPGRDPLRRVHRPPGRDVAARRQARRPAARLHAPGRAAGARAGAGAARGRRTALRAADRDAVRGGRGAAHPQPRQHHLARRGRHRQRRHPDRDGGGQLLRGQRAVPAPAGRQGDRARGLPVGGLDGQPAVPVRGGPAARRRHRRGRGPVRDRRPQRRRRGQRPGRSTPRRSPSE